MFAAVVNATSQCQSDWESRQLSPCQHDIVTDFIVWIVSAHLRQVIYAVLFVACSALWWRYDEICKRDDPLLRIPGPLCLPLIGSVLSFGNVPHLAFLELRKRYGDVYRVQIGSVPVVILNGVGVIREALVGQGDIFSGRPDLMTFRLASEGNLCVA